MIHYWILINDHFVLCPNILVQATRIPIDTTVARARVLVKCYMCVTWGIGEHNV